MYVHFAPHHSSDLSRWLPSAGPKEYLLGNKPFHHTVDWREVAIAFNPEGAQREELKYPETSPTTSKRKEEARWLQRLYDDTEFIDRVRRNGQEAFAHSMNVELNSRGVVNALLAELPHTLDQKGILMPPPHMQRSGIRYFYD